MLIHFSAKGHRESEGRPPKEEIGSHIRLYQNLNPGQFEVFTGQAAARMRERVVFTSLSSVPAERETRKTPKAGCARGVNVAPRQR